MSTIALELSANPSIFFDTDFIRDRIDQRSLQRLSQAGAFVRQRARHSIRSRSRVSRPGEPPSSHDGRLREGILFAADTRQDSPSVVIGPRLTQHTGDYQSGRVTKGGVPKVLEFGGRLTLVERLVSQPGQSPIWWTLSVRRQQQGFDHPVTLRRRTVLIAARPYMRPALDKEVGKLPELFAGLL